MPRRPFRVAVLVALLASSLLAWSADEPEKPSKGPEEFKGLKFRLVGPGAGGRVSRVTGVPGDPLVYFAASASGGVWKSENGGVPWKPSFGEQPHPAIGASSRPASAP